MEVDFNVLKGDIDTAEVLRNTAKSDRERCYRGTYIRGGDIIHTRYAFKKKLQARIERCDRGLWSDPLHSNPEGNLLVYRYQSPRLATLSTNSQSVFATKTFRSVTLQHSPVDLITFLPFSLILIFSLPNDSFHRPPRSFLCPILYYFCHDLRFLENWILHIYMYIYIYLYIFFFFNLLYIRYSKTIIQKCDWSVLRKKKRPSFSKITDGISALCSFRCS